MPARSQRNTTRLERVAYALLSCSDYIQIVMERLAQLADLERRVRAVEVTAPEMRLAEGEVDEDPAFPKDSVNSGATLS